MVFLLCEISYEFSSGYFEKKLCRKLHMNMGFLLYEFSCVVSKQSGKGNALPQTLQLYGVSPVWVTMCFFKLRLSVKALPQISQWKGVSPVWTLTCLFKVPFSRNDLPQASQENGVSPVWEVICLFRLPSWEKDFPQTSQGNGVLSCMNY